MKKTIETITHINTGKTIDASTVIDPLPELFIIKLLFLVFLIAFIY
jgi:hypothetical protein